MLPVAKAPPRPTVLVVDDDPENIAVLSASLRSCCVVRVATSGTKALGIIGSEDPPDLILLDITMPGINGLDLCRKLQGSRACRHIPIIFVSAHSEVEDECQGLALGAVDYIKKPVNPSIVRARVLIHLELKHARDALERRNEILEAKLSLQATQRLERAGQFGDDPAFSASPARKV